MKKRTKAIYSSITALIVILVLGMTQAAIAADYPPSITLNATFRDFTPQTNPDFESKAGYVKDLVLPDLGLDGNPVYSGIPNSVITSAASFNQWYNDVPGVNQTIVLPLTLTRDGTGTTYSYLSNSFFPLDNMLFGNYASFAHNYHFTMELHTRFTYQGAETYSFSGDDDVWVFINKKLVIDLGGVHAQMSQTVSLDSIASKIGIETGKSYDFDLFFAERHTTGSNFNMTTSIVFDLNQPPVANAGPDQTVTATALDGATVQLDGSLSSDPEGKPLSYTWTWASGSATGVKPSVKLPIGTTTVTLAVSDGQLASSDTVNIKVINQQSKATVDVNPNTINKKSRSDKNAITVYIEFAENTQPAKVDISTIKLEVNGKIFNCQARPTAIGDYDHDGFLDLMVKFDRALIIPALIDGTDEMIITGSFSDIGTFKGSDTVKVIK